MSCSYTAVSRIVDPSQASTGDSQKRRFRPGSEAADGASTRTGPATPVEVSVAEYIVKSADHAMAYPFEVATAVALSRFTNEPKIRVSPRIAPLDASRRAIRR